ncbi:MAG: lipid-A-disaccharide synthase, partial [Muribaculaceae bacterium]|nr:lipid-A-disaccharide synthase [Muribaculaceae bacterium]
MRNLKFFLSAGEASGDLHGARLVGSLRRECEAMGCGCSFVFLGGDEMARQCGCEPLVDYRRMAYMGFVDVARNLGNIRRNLAVARRGLRESRPDALVLIDYPSFNFRLAREAQSLGIPVYYYIAPKVWAWKKWRVKQMRRWCRMVLSILPFEVEFFRQRGVDCRFVGNPTAGEVAERRRELVPRHELMRQAGLPADSRYIALVPGSRHGEIKANLPVMAEAAGRFADCRVVVAGAPGMSAEIYRRYCPGLPGVF